MTLIVEDGSAVPNAESYISVAEADTYFANRGKADAWDAAPDKEQMLRLATDYMLGMYRDRWKGYRFTVTQALDWPRAWVPMPDSITTYGPYPYYYPQNVVPDAVKHACAELALRAINGDLTPDLTPEDLAAQIRVGPIDIRYSTGGSNVVIFRQIDLMLKTLVKGGTGMTRLVRA